MRYDALNRTTILKCANDYKTVATYTYDALGRRVRKVISNGGLTSDLTDRATDYLSSGVLDMSAWQRAAAGLNWRAALTQPQDEKVIASLRPCTSRGRPLGSDSFVSKLERRMGCLWRSCVAVSANSAGVCEMKSARR